VQLAKLSLAIVAGVNGEGVREAKNAIEHSLPLSSVLRLLAVRLEVVMIACVQTSDIYLARRLQAGHNAGCSNDCTNTNMHSTSK